ncbi:MAG: hypothetical protein K0R83_2951 [Caulobacter sp.]|nr:hypothetical protein [Caulobacter sp.]
MLGSVKTAVGRISALAIFGSHCAFWSFVPPVRISSAAISERVAREPTPIQARLSSSETTHMAVLPRPAPPYSSGMVRPKTPRSPSSLTSASGISSSFRCHWWAKGTTFSSAKAWNWSRIISKVSSRPVSSTVGLPRASATSWATRVFTAWPPASPTQRDRAGANSLRTVAWSAVRSEGRIVSPWFIGTPPISWLAYSANNSWASRASVSLNLPAASSAEAQPATWVSSSA